MGVGGHIYMRTKGTMGDLVNTLLSGGVAVALITIAGQLLFWWLDNRAEAPDTEAEVPVEEFEDLIEVQQIMERALSKSGAQRFLILKTENGGGKPRLGTHLYASVLYEAVREPIVSVKEDYQRLLVDDIYVRMLSDIGPNHPNKLKVSDMKDGILKRIYIKDNIEYSEIHYLTETNNAFFYASIATSEEDNVFDDPIERVELEIALSKVINIFNNVSDN